MSVPKNDTNETIHLSENREATIEDRPAQYGNGSERVAVLPGRKSRVLTGNDALQIARALLPADRLIDAADTIKRAEYYSSVRSLAEDIADDLKRGDISDREQLLERVQETADGSSWVIYTASAMEVLRYSDNDGAYVDNFGTEGVVRDGSINWSALAYAALEQDINEHLEAIGVDVNMPFKCETCDETFDSHDDLTSHVESDHPKEETPTEG